jgi:hypothetical protein
MLSFQFVDGRIECPAQLAQSHEFSLCAGNAVQPAQPGRFGVLDWSLGIWRDKIK